VNALTIASAAKAAGGSTLASALQRKCACGNTASGITGVCEECQRQRAFGLQPGLELSAGDDTPEQDTDHAAHQMHAHHLPLASPPSGRGHDFGNVRVRHAAAVSPQRKLTVNAPGDEHEREADRVADEVMRMPAPPEADDNEMVRSALGAAIGQKCGACEKQELQRQTMEDEKDEEDESLQAKELPGRTPVVTTQIQSTIDTLRGGGQPLPESVRTFYEPRLGVDFASTRIHTGPTAAETAQALNARAFTLGRDIFFGSRQFAPRTEGGRRLLAHELTHVIQQGAAPARLPDPRSDESAPEVEADTHVIGSTWPEELESTSDTTRSRLDFVRATPANTTTTGEVLRRKPQPNEERADRKAKRREARAQRRAKRQEARAERRTKRREARAERRRKRSEVEFEDPNPIGIEAVATTAFERASAMADQITTALMFGAFPQDLYYKRFGEPTPDASGQYPNRISGSLHATLEEATASEMHDIGQRFASISLYFGADVEFHFPAIGVTVPIQGCTPTACGASTLAFVCPFRFPREIVICPHFYDFDTEQQAGFLMHEVGHRMLQLQDFDLAPYAGPFADRIREAECLTSLAADYFGFAAVDPSCPPLT
jgi:Domain of unknown function (DUF4157)